MKQMKRSYIGAALGLCLLFAASARPQVQANDLRAGYNRARETNLVGTVTSFTADSQTGPLGAHAIVQTASGAVDVHLGSAKFLEVNHLTLASGDSVRIIGESVVNGANTVFLARIVQKGTTAVAVRSPHGMPLWFAGARVANGANKKTQGGAL